MFDGWARQARLSIAGTLAPRMGATRLVIHGHFYQPPRDNPWTEQVAVEPSAAPFHDWNERITAECYRPNGWARVVDDRGRVADIVDNYEHLSFNVGPTLLAWLEHHAPDVYRRILDADARGGGAIAQAYGHAILPLCNDRDLRTQVRWGLADFAHRFGRPAEGMWLPETAVDDRVLSVLAEEGIRFTLLAPHQAATTVVGGRPYRWRHPARPDLGVEVVFYDGPISHDLAFGLTGMSTQELLHRVTDAGHESGSVCVATDGETFGHHHKFAERALAYAFAGAADDAGVEVANLATLCRDTSPGDDVEVVQSSWSCVHGIERWRSDCGCSTGGEPGWNQSWRAPLRAALDLLRDHAVDVFERVGGGVLREPWQARDAYIDVILGRLDVEVFLRAWLQPGAHERTALALLEAQRHALLMYTSCGWFFNDLAGLETVQVMRYAARCIDLLDEVGEPAPVEAFLDALATAASNRPEEGDGRQVWDRHVAPTRVDGGRVAAHLALVTLLEEGRAAPAQLAGFDVEQHVHERRGRAGVDGCGGRVTLVHRRTHRRDHYVYAAIRLAGLEVYGAVRAADPDPTVDEARFGALRRAVESGARVSTVIRVIAEEFGPREFGLESALPDAAAQIVQGAVDALVDRFGNTYEQLYADHRPLLEALVTAGYPLPAELQASSGFALARRFEAEVAAMADPSDVEAYRAARQIIREARGAGVSLRSPRAEAIVTRTLEDAVAGAVASPDLVHVGGALALLRLVRELELHVDLDRAQELVWDAADRPQLESLAGALGLAVR
jgi:alpha-amylase/alpha-mannosidase (GH57 family)